MTQTTKNFKSANDAMLWLVDNCGLWAGMSPEALDEAYAQLDWRGYAILCSPLGDVFVAVLEQGE
jgi:hypothetical protein